MAEGRAKNNSKLLEVGELIDAGLYDQVAGLIHSGQKSSYLLNNIVSVEILDAAHQICLACQQFRTEKKQHQRACEEADQREQALREQLREIFNLIIQDSLNQNGKRNKAQHTDMKSRTESPELEEPSSILQRIKIKLRFPGSKPSPNKETSPELVGEDPREAFDAQIPIIPPSNKETATTSRGFDPSPEEQSAPSLVVYCLGLFQVYQNDLLVEEWPSSKGKSIFKYLVAQRKHPVPKEILMELFWPESHSDAARNNLNVSIYGLRQALRNTNPDYSHILFQEECYLLNPEMAFWIDVEEFSRLFKTGRNKEIRGNLELAVQAYQASETLYQGEFLSEDRYEDWLIPQRQSLQDDYLKLLDSLSNYYLAQKDITACIAVCHKILTVDPYLEGAHRQLMRCYSCQGQPHLAIQQFHKCKKALKGGFNLPPSQTTQNLCWQIQAGKQVSIT